jgi:hypothetical protein
VVRKSFSRVRRVIDRRCELSKVFEALRYLGEGCSRGKVIVTVLGSDQAAAAQVENQLTASFTDPDGHIWEIAQG